MVGKRRRHSDGGRPAGDAAVEATAEVATPDVPTVEAEVAPADTGDAADGTATAEAVVDALPVAEAADEDNEVIGLPAAESDEPEAKKAKTAE